MGRKEVAGGKWSHRSGSMCIKIVIGKMLKTQRTKVSPYLPEPYNIGAKAGCTLQEVNVLHFGVQKANITQESEIPPSVPKTHQPPHRPLYKSLDTRTTRFVECLLTGPTALYYSYPRMCSPYPATFFQETARQTIVEIQGEQVSSL